MLHISRTPSNGFVNLGHKTAHNFCGLAYARQTTMCNRAENELVHPTGIEISLSYNSFLFRAGQTSLMLPSWRNVQYCRRQNGSATVRGNESFSNALKC